MNHRPGLRAPRPGEFHSGHNFPSGQDNLSKLFGKIFDLSQTTWPCREC